MNKPYIVDHSYEGIRIDKWIRNNLGNVPQGLIEKSLRAGKIKLNKKKTKRSVANLPSGYKQSEKKAFKQTKKWNKVNRKKL